MGGGGWWRHGGWAQLEFLFFSFAMVWPGLTLTIILDTWLGVGRGKFVCAQALGPMSGAPEGEDSIHLDS